MKAELANAWGEFLGRYPWDWFMTLTFADPVRSFTGHRKFERFATEIEAAAGTAIAWFRGDDYGWQGGRFHIHALMMHVASLSPFLWMKRWEKWAGYARIVNYDPSLGASYYIGQHVAGDFGDWKFSDRVDALLVSNGSPQKISLPDSRPAAIRSNSDG